MYKVETKNVTGDIRRMLESYAKVLKVNIFAQGSKDGEGWFYYPNSKKGWLNIYFYASPSVGAYSSVGKEDYDRAFGFSLGGAQSVGMAPSLVGYPINDPEGNIVAEVVENTIYVLFDLADDFNWIDDESATILQLILECYTKLPSLDERRKLEGKKKMELRGETYSNFRELFDLNGQFQKGNIKKQFDVITSIAEGDLVVHNGEIRIPLGRKYYRDSYEPQSRKINIGEILIVLVPGELEDGDFVRTYYLDPKYKEKHRFIFCGGDQCLGNIYSGVKAFVRDHEFAFATEAVKLFVEES